MQDIDYVTVTRLPEKTLIELHMSKSSQTVGCFTLTDKAMVDLYQQLDRCVKIPNDLLEAHR